jgi:hypothetical protein
VKDLSRQRQAGVNQFEEVNCYWAPYHTRVSAKVDYQQLDGRTAKPQECKLYRRRLECELGSRKCMVGQTKQRLGEPQRGPNDGLVGDTLQKIDSMVFKAKSVTRLVGQSRFVSPLLTQTKPKHHTLTVSVAVRSIFQ